MPSVYEHHYMKPRPRDPSAELAQSYYERRIDLAAVGGLAGIREIRRRIAAMATLKARIGERPATLAEMDEVLAPVPCARTRLRLGELRTELYGPPPKRLRKPATIAEREKARARKKARQAEGVLCERTVRAILDAAARHFRPGDRVTLSQIAALVGRSESAVSWYVHGLTLRGLWPYARGKGRPRKEG